MLQQTQVARVLERYAPWLERWPTPAALAAAPAADVLRAWSGLGYNRRALNLQNAARRVVELGGSRARSTSSSELPGVGPYTARAIACFAFGAQVTALDTNVRRVLERSLGTTRRRAAAGRAWDWNQALFDLGAQVCLGARAALRSLPARRLVPVARAHVRAAAPSEPLRGLAAAAPRRARARARGGPAREATATIETWSTRCSPTAWPCAAPTACSRFPRRSPHREHPRLRRQCRQLPGVKPGERFQALVDEPFADVGTRLCDAALAAGAASAACVVVPDSARPLLTSYEPLRGLAGRDRRASASGSCTSTTASSRASASRSTRARARPGRASPSAGAWTARCWSTRWRPTTARCASSPRASAQRLAGSRRVRVTTPGGTDCTFDVTGREWKLDDGVLDQPGAFGNLPAGEVFVAPLATGADGVCVIDRSIALGGEGLVDEPIRLDVRAAGASSPSRAAARPTRRARRSPRRAPAPTSWPSSASARTPARASRAASSPTRRCSARRTSRSATTRARATAATTSAAIHVDGVMADATIEADGVVVIDARGARSEPADQQRDGLAGRALAAAREAEAVGAGARAPRRGRRSHRARRPRARAWPR